jgi:hypothetical protein
MENIQAKQKQAVTESRDVTGINFASFIGVDLHQTTVTLRAVDSNESVISSLTIDTKCVNKIEDWINALPRPRWMAVETVSFVEWFIDRYRDCVERIDIADATPANIMAMMTPNSSTDIETVSNELTSLMPHLPISWP